MTKKVSGKKSKDYEIYTAPEEINDGQLVILNDDNKRFVGVCLGHETITIKKSGTENKLFHFLPFSLKTKKILEFEVSKMFGSVVLNRLLTQLKNGDIVIIDYKGKSGQTKLFDVLKIGTVRNSLLYNDYLLGEVE